MAFRLHQSVFSGCGSQPLASDDMARASACRPSVKLWGAQGDVCAICAEAVSIRVDGQGCSPYKDHSNGDLCSVVLGCACCCAERATITLADGACLQVCSPSVCVRARVHACVSSCSCMYLCPCGCFACARMRVRAASGKLDSHCGDESIAFKI